ncbi:hypothetical protein M885DRAFT_500519 [Pelagophyceae sp. CCMP2097]|nr:hypothetical protein M885DRAFT_500519 [Pelagophyceae sp. CCMP2097]
MRSESILAHVVLWDQLARHAVRVGDASHSDAVAPARFADRAVSAARELVARDDAWPATYKSFALMPLRHTFDAGVLNLEVLPTMRKWRAAGGNADDAKVWQRFEAATLRALCRVTTQTLDPVAVPDAPQAADGGEVDWLGDFSDVLEPPLPSLSAALAARAPHASFDDGGNRRHVSSLETYKCVKRFLLDDAVSEAPDEEPDVGDGEEAPKPAARAVPRTVVVSVSGGVDSMLLLWVVARLAASEAVFAGMRVHAVHINYGNRGVSEREADFVQKWCGWLGVPLWRRDVTELAKASTASRADYEDVTRDVRFDVYKRALGEDVSAAALSEQAAFSAPPPASSRRAPAGRSAGLVLLGHNRQDASENLFTNINRGQHYENLRGMAPLSVERGVTVARPMLGIDKKTIYADAAKLHVPHTRDSTDPLCERGMLRDKWLPAVNAQQPLLIPGLERLADHVTFM